MSFNLTPGSQSGFREWSEEDWNGFWAKNADKTQAVCEWSALREIVETVRVNLESGKAGSVFPYFHQIAVEGFHGWYHRDLAKVINEIGDIRKKLQELPPARQIRVETDLLGNTVSVKTYEETALAKRIAVFEAAHPGRFVRTLLDLNDQILRAIAEAATKAQDGNKGLIVSR